MLPFLLLDENTRRHCLPVWERLSGRSDYIIIEIPSGEIHKNLDTCRHIWNELLRHGADRKSLLINLGGGVIGDMGGFCAATYKRGIEFVQVPTTLLSMVDAAHGGKLGIDFGGLKNSVGLFGEAKSIHIHPVFLKTLPPREILSGFAEMLKHALIADAGQWEMLKKMDNLAEADWETLIPASIAIKQRIVESDPFEKGPRKALNFGHTVGHALESYFLETATPILHGEAVAMGMLAETRLSVSLAGFPEKEATEIEGHLRRWYKFPLVPEMAHEELLRLMRQDKKNEGGEILFTLLEKIGEAKLNCSIRASDLLEMLEKFH